MFFKKQWNTNVKLKMYQALMNWYDLNRNAHYSKYNVINLTLNLTKDEEHDF